MLCWSPDNFNTSIPFSLDQCSKIIYNNFEFESTIVTRNNLICGEQYKVTLYFLKFPCIVLTDLSGGTCGQSLYGRNVLWLFHIWIPWRSLGKETHSDGSYHDW